MDISQKDFSGLTNLGNTCYLNACIQVLSKTEELNTFLNNLKKIKDNSDAIILQEYNGLRKIMAGNSTISPNRFLHFLREMAKKKGNTAFVGYQQNDLSEFLSFLLDSLHNSVCRPIQVQVSGKSEHSVDDLAIICYNYIKSVYEKEYSEIMDIFHGVYVSVIETRRNKMHATTPEYYNILNLPMSDKTQNIYDCFDLYIASEIIEDYYNDKTKKRETVNRRILFWNFPKILIICLKRYTNTIRKKNDIVECPQTLDLCKYVQGYNRSSNVFELYAVCNHIGGVQGGHYTCNIRHKGKWVHINDDDIHIMRGNEKVITPQTYCLFYRKKNT
jgi:ubiquitin carboxyl-terminal hydrolase 21